MTPECVFEMKEWLHGDTADSTYASAFPGMADFCKHVKDSALEIELGIAGILDHMIPFNGDRLP